MLSIQIVRNTYFAVYQYIFQYGFLVWVCVKDENINIFQRNQNNILKIILNKKTLEGLTKQNNKFLSVLQTASNRLLYEKIQYIL